jgi:hypothetical protein
MKKTRFEFVKEHWQPGLSYLLNGKAFQRIRGKNLSPLEYACVLRQAYHQYKEHPQALARLTSKLSGPARGAIKQILAHALYEVDHEDFALRDMRSLGLNVEWCRQTNPLPMTRAILGFMNGLIDGPVPVSILGYFFHFEMLPLEMGKDIVQLLGESGIDPNSHSFFFERSHSDEAVRQKLIENCLEEIVENQEQLDEIAQAAKASAILHSQLLDEAIDPKRNQIWGLPMGPNDFLETQSPNPTIPFLISSY